MNLTSCYMFTNPGPPPESLAPPSFLALVSVFALNAYGTGNAIWMSQRSPSWKHEKLPHAQCATGAGPSLLQAPRLEILKFSKN